MYIAYYSTSHGIWGTEGRCRSSFARELVFVANAAQCCNGQTMHLIALEQDFCRDSKSSKHGTPSAKLKLVLQMQGG